MFAAVALVVVGRSVGIPYDIPNVSFLPLITYPGTISSILCCSAIEKRTLLAII